MQVKRLAAAMAAAGLALAGAAQAQQAGQQGTQAQARSAAQQQRLSAQDREFIEDAAQSGLAEVSASEIALRSIQDPQVRRFAQRMIDDHTKAHRQLVQIAQRKDVDVPTDPSFLQQGRLQLLQMQRGHDLRQAYVEGFGVDAHQSAVSLFQNEVETGRDPDVTAFARRTLPALKEHLQMARQLRRDQNAGAGAAAGSGAMGAARDARIGAGHAMSGAERADSSEAREARHEIDQAVQVVQRMKGDPQVRDALARAKGVFILPAYGRGGLGVGAQGGSGVLVTRTGDGFSNPVFYNLAGVSVGAQAGVSGGPVAMLLMTNEAVRDFRSGKNFSLAGDAALTVVDWSRRGQVSGGKVQDVIVWSGTKGAYAGASIGATDIWYDREATEAYYGRNGLQPSRILDGGVQPPGSNVLGMVLAV